MRSLFLFFYFKIIIKHYVRRSLALFNKSTRHFVNYVNSIMVTLFFFRWLHDDAFGVKTIFILIDKNLYFMSRRRYSSDLC